MHKVYRVFRLDFMSNFVNAFQVIVIFLTGIIPSIFVRFNLAFSNIK